MVWFVVPFEEFGKFVDQRETGSLLWAKTVPNDDFEVCHEGFIFENRQFDDFM
jgi:hypothetical protein